MGLFKTEISERKPHDLPDEITCIEDALNIVRAIFNTLQAQKNDPFFANDLLTPQNLFLDIWYRGENKDYGETALLPKIFRNEKGVYDESKIYNFLPTYHHELSDITNDLDRLSYMQNYNVPTRLLDWTDNILMGLYFAVEDVNIMEDEENNNQNSGKLYILNSRLLNHYTSLKQGLKNIPGKDDIATNFRCALVNSDSTNEWYEKVIPQIGAFNWGKEDLNHNPIKYLAGIDVETKKAEQNTSKAQEAKDLAKVFAPPVAVQPDKTHNARVAQQGTYFTLFGGKNPIETTNLPQPFKFQDVQKRLKQNGLNGKFYMAFTVPSDKKAEIKQELLNLQIHKGKVYPELEKQDELVDLIGLNKKGK